MTAMGEIQQVGSGLNADNVLEVDGTFGAGRVSMRPFEYQIKNGIQGGHYRGAFAFANTANKPTGAGDILALRWTDTARLFILKSMYLSVLCTTAFTAAQVMIANLYKATAYSASPSAGTGIAGVPLQASRMAVSGVASGGPGIGFVSSGDAVTAGTRTLSAAIGSVPMILPASTGIILATTPLFEADHVYDHPLVLGVNEGLVLQWDRANAQAAGVATWTVTMDWAEVAAF